MNHFRCIRFVFLFSFVFSLIGCGEDRIQIGSQGDPGRDGLNALMVSSVEPEGAHCAKGGVRIDAGLDADGDGVLSKDEITSTQYVCTAEPNTANTLMVSSVEPEGAHCVKGGIRIDIGLDQNADGELSEDEIKSTQYVCAAEPGDPGAPGMDAHCANNAAPMVSVGSPLLETYWVGAAYSLKVAANKAGLDFQFITQNLKIEWESEEVTLEGSYVSSWKLTPLAEARQLSATLVASDGCQMVTTGFHLENIQPSLIDWVTIPAGTFQSAIPNSGKVSLDTFKLARTETTVAQFEKCVAVGACSPEHFASYNENAEINSQTSQTVNDSLIRYGKICNLGRGDGWLSHPMNCVTHEGASQFCEWIGGRLPTEDEWHYAAASDRNGARETIYPWGNEEPTCLHGNGGFFSEELIQYIYCDVEYIEVEGYDYDFFIFNTHSVGTYSPAGDSPLGLQHMIGNVWHWTASLKDSEDAIVRGDGLYHVSQYLSPDELVYRNNWGIDDWHSLIGFRCAD